MTKSLRPYQAIAIQECLSELIKHDDPVLLMASVGSGKSLMLSEILLRFERQGKRALCIVNNAELIRNNAETFRQQRGNPSIYSAGLGETCIDNPIVFGTPQSVLNGIKRNDPISHIKFNIIIVDESHMINYKDHKTTFMRLLRHYKQEYPAMRVLGATGTNFRYKGEPIVGEECLFKKQVGNITTHWLIEQGYLVRPKFEVEGSIDFSSVKLNSMGKFDAKQLEEVVEKNQRLTAQILTHLQEIMASQNRFGCFIFCVSKKHCDEARLSLPSEQTAVITGDMPQKERTIILDKARRGEIKYLINIQVLTVGVDVPGYDTLLFLRPTESLVLAVQMIGRVLRLYPGKESALILDCAGNIERHADWDDPVILDAITQTRDANQELIFPCPICDTMNSEHTRRCVGLKETKRCEFYFEWKDCHECNKKNDLVSRYCRYCDAELIDPNAKLVPINPTIEVEVIQAKYWLQESGRYTQWRASYLFQLNQETSPVTLYESFTPTASDKAKNMFYGSWVRKHLINPSYWYPHLNNPIYLKAMLNQVQSPTHLKLKWEGSQWIIKNKVFPTPDNLQLTIALQDTQ